MVHNVKMCFLQMSQLAHYKAFHTPWSHFIFCYDGKSSKVPFRTQGLLPLVAGCDVTQLLQELHGSCQSGGV
jgi:hypothetical protein